MLDRYYIDPALHTMWAASVNITEQERQPQIIIMSTLILSLSFITSAVVAINTGLDSAWYCFTVYYII